jgi:hypothetical protein
MKGSSPATVTGGEKISKKVSSSQPSNPSPFLTIKITFLGLTKRQVDEAASWQNDPAPNLHSLKKNDNEKRFFVTPKKLFFVEMIISF